MAWVAPAPPAGHAHLIMRINGRCRVKRETPSTHSKKTHTHTHTKKQKTNTERAARRGPFSLRKWKCDEQKRNKTNNPHKKKSTAEKHEPTNQ